MNRYRFCPEGEKREKGEKGEKNKYNVKTNINISCDV